MKSFEWYFPYSSRRMPVMAQNVVATSQPLASQAGLRILLNGGNAVDAAIAAAVTLSVVEPTSNGIGGDAFAIVRYGNELFGLNASGRSPAAWDLKVFSEMEMMPRYGWNSVTVPGAVSGWVELSRRFGKLPFADLFEPAIEYARNGFLVSPITAAAWSRAAKIYKEFPDFCAAYLPGGQAPKGGELFALPDQAKSLERIAETNGEAFYRGDIADMIVTHAAKNGGLMTKQDLSTHKPEWVKTLTLDYKGYTLHELPPNTQGAGALIALGILQHLKISDYPVDNADSIHLQIEATKLALTDISQHVADPAGMKIQIQDLVTSDYCAGQAEKIDLKQARVSDDTLLRDGGTVYLSTADSNGMMVSLIQSNFWSFGSGIVIPGTGISLHNRGYGFTLKPGHPNQIAGKKRPLHTIIPGFVTRENQPLMAYGVMGGAFQIQGHVQLMVRILDYEQNPQTALDAPRWRINEDGSILVEDGFKPEVLHDLMSRGHKIKKVDFTSFGGAQLIYVFQDGYCGASDHRKDGQAVGF